MSCRSPYPPPPKKKYCVYLLISLIFKLFSKWDFCDSGGEIIVKKSQIFRRGHLNASKGFLSFPGPSPPPYLNSILLEKFEKFLNILPWIETYNKQFLSLLLINSIICIRSQYSQSSKNSKSFSPTAYWSSKNPISFPPVAYRSSFSEKDQFSSNRWQYYCWIVYFLNGNGLFSLSVVYTPRFRGFKKNDF